MIDVLTIGEAMAALRASEPLRLGGQLRLTTAGSEANVATGLARLGHAVRWVGVLGGDEFGALVLRTLRAENIDVSCVRTDPEHPTGLIVFEPRIADVVRVTYYRSGSAGSQLGPDDVSAAFGAGSSGSPAVVPRALHLTGITPALGARPRAAVLTALRLARSAGTTVCLDVNHRSTLWSDAEASDFLGDLVPEVDVLVGSDDEIALVGSVAEALRRGPREVVVKRGADGASVHTTSGVVHREARQVPVRDTMGAGDAFVAGYLSGLLDGLEPAGRLDRAVTVGAFAVGVEGDWQGLPTRDELSLLDLAPGSAVR